MVRCEICEAKEATHKCEICGREVCDRHFDPKKGICEICSEALCEICGERLSVGYCEVCGRIGCEDCLIQINVTKYVCKECYYSSRYRLRGSRS